MTAELTAIVMAAGLGKRMKSALPKVLHRAAGRRLVAYPIRAALDAGATRVVAVVSRDIRDEVERTLGSELSEARIDVVVQDPPQGTGDAARVGLAGVETESVLILSGDTPLIRADDIRLLLQALDADPDATLSFLTAVLDDPTGYGRVIRDEDGRAIEIREQRDLQSLAQAAIREVNAGLYAAKTSALREALLHIRNDNAQSEYYLTDVVALSAATGGARAVIGHRENLVGVNDRSQLVAAEELLFERIRLRHQLAGATIKSGARIDDTAEIEPDSLIEAGAVVRGKSRISSGATLDVGCVVTDSEIGKNANIKPYSVVTESRVGEGAQIGPFAHLRPASEIDQDAHIGNFVETKKTRVRKGAKANHLAYLGDGDIGEGANVGAGTIFCNYDGFKKHKTVIGAGAFIGSDSQLVAPVTVGENSYVGTGTTVTKDVPADALAIARVPQENKLGYAPRLRARLSAGSKKT